MDRDDSFCVMKNPAEPSPVPGVGSDDEESFVVLSTSFNDEAVEGSFKEETLPPIKSSKIYDMQNSIKMEISQLTNAGTVPEIPVVASTLNDVSSSVANIILSPDASYEEIQKHVEDLIKENEKFKLIIAQNNLSMRTQYDRILAWKEEVNKVLASYKNKFAEAKAYVDKCKEESSKLASDVEKYKKIKELQDEEIINLKRKEKENIGTISDTSEQNLAEFDLQIATGKVKELQTALAEANLKNIEVSKENEKLVEKLVTITPKLEEQLQNKQSEIDELKLNIKASENNEKELSDHISSLKIEISRLQEAFNNVSQDNQKPSNIKYQEQLDLKETEIVNLHQEIVGLKDRAANNERILAEEVTTLKNKLQALQEFYDPGSQEKFEQVRHQLMASQMRITALEQEIKEKEKEVDRLEELLKLSSNNDEIFALREQLTLYKNDFEAEKEASNATKREKDQIAEDLQNLQRRNEQLQGEIELFRDRSKAKEGYSCPKCDFGFNSYQSLENHVHRCLDLDGFP